MTDRQDDLTLLERIASGRFDGSEPLHAMKLLGLDPGYFPAVRAILQQGRWRHAKSALAYVRVAAEREARRMGLVDDDPAALPLLVPEGMPVDQHIDYLHHHRGGDDFEPDERRLDRVVPTLLLDRGGDYIQIDWTRVAQCAGLDEAEAEVLRLRALGITREDFDPSDPEDRELLAAARRLSRKFARVRGVLLGEAPEKKFSRNVPNFRKGRTE